MGQLSTQRRCCLNCHFLMKWTRNQNGNEHKFEVAPEDRMRFAAGESDDKILGGEWSIACFQNVWDWANRPDSCNDLRDVLSIERAESCFFYPHKQGMFFPAAAELERRAADRREAKRDRNMTKWGIIIGLVGVVFGAVLTKIFS